MTTNHDGGGMAYFAMLTQDEQRSAIFRLARAGMNDHAIASITGLAVEQIRRVLAESEKLQKRASIS